ncbi:MAG: type restriction enzyme [Chloroflexota bacterium]|nr:type restriction enzyme [Chloroflexota bacterium]
MSPRRAKASAEQPSLLDARVTTAACVPAIREALAEWRDSKYKGATPTSRKLLNYWFGTDHRMPGGGGFRYHNSQRDATETLIYLYEVAKARTHRDLLEQFAPNVPGIHILQYDDFARYAIKMATGSGKTKVIALAMAWQYFNAVAEGRDDYARTFLLIAPNVIVFERLRTDFAGGRIFHADPMIPPELEVYWDVDCYMRGEPERASSQGAVYVTNIHQFHDRPEASDDDEPEEMRAMLGPVAPPSTAKADEFAARIIKRGGPMLVANDEGHHTHDEDSEWNGVIRRLHSEIAGGLIAQLDFSATPRYAKGGLFTWTVYDYPLKQAIIDNVVKRPTKGVTAGMGEQPSDVASTKYQAYLTAGVERWREYRKLLAPLGKKPILFVMLNVTSEADDVGDYLRGQYPEDFGGERLLVIHTNKSGEISKGSLESARETARQVDEGSSPVNAIVSVLMLREGWDVQNVTVIVGLRPYTSKANILPEQTIGRGLRLMFGNLGSAYTERVDIIGNPAFLKFVDQLEREEDITLDTFDLKEPLVIQTVVPDQAKLDRDIAIPVLGPILARKKTLAEEIAALDVLTFVCPSLPRKPNDKAAQSFRYEGKDIITLEQIVEREYKVPEPRTAEEVISYYAKRIAQDVKLPSQFAALVPKVREFLEAKAFGEVVDLAKPEMVKAISTPVAGYMTIRTFAAALRGLVVEELTPSLEGAGRNLSATEGFPFSRPTFAASKTLFNLVAADNEFEREFARFLQSSPDVHAFAKLPPTSRFPFAIEYTDNAVNLRYYEPDFVVIAGDGTHWLIETKGREDLDVAHKDRAARIWCDNATLLTEVAWRYVKVPQMEFVKLQPAEFSEVAVAFEER